MYIISVLHNVRREIKMDCSDERNGNIPGCQAKFVKGEVKKVSRINRFVY